MAASKHRLVMDMRDERPTNLEALLFGVLVEHCAFPIVQSYTSDLYYDAIWLNTYRPDSFYYATRQGGTFIAEDNEDNLEAARNHNERVWHVGIVRDDRDTWHAILTDVTQP